jgi:GT2 family glycosyltransferase
LLYCEKECQNSLISIAQFNSAGTHLSSFGIFPNALNQIGLLRSLQRDVLSRTQNRKVVFKSKFSEVDWISGSFVLMTQDNFKSIGGWDERFWMYFEDVDLCLRAREKGIRILVLNFWECIHDHGGASRKTTRTKIITKSHVLISNLLFIRKHFAFPKRELALLFFLLSKFFNTLFIPKKSNLVPFVNLIKYLISNKKP